MNRRHADFQSAALPTELPGRSFLSHAKGVQYKYSLSDCQPRLDSVSNSRSVTHKGRYIWSKQTKAFDRYFYRSLDCFHCFSLPLLLSSSLCWASLLAASCGDSSLSLSFLRAQRLVLHCRQTPSDSPNSPTTAFSSRCVTRSKIADDC